MAIFLSAAALTDEDKAMLAAADALLEITRDEMGKQMIHRALAAIIAVVSETDRYFAGQEPWALKKTDPARMATVLYVTAEVVRQIAILLQPFMPESVEENCSTWWQPQPTSATLRHSARPAVLCSGTPLEAPKPVFPRYVAPEA
ncbi:class I tRNA ligase family protein [Ensifer canadensis]